MKIVHAYPPNLEAIAAVLPDAKKPGVLFCYGDTIYCPTTDYLTHEIVAHEEVHSLRQAANPGGVDGWWSQYIADPNFRYGEELPAHQREYAAILRATKNRRFRRAYLEAIAGRLAGPLYGGCVSHEEAVKAVEHGAVPFLKHWGDDEWLLATCRDYWRP